MPATKADNKSDNSRLECMELKIDKLTEIIEKYDIPSVADKAQKANENFNVFNNSCKEYITRLNKAMQVLDKSITNNENISHKSECPDTEQKFKERGKEINTLRSSELLLLTLIKEKDNSISELRSSKDKNMKTINENNSSIQLLRQQVDKYKDMEMKLNEQHRVIDRLNDTVSDLQSKSSERELLLDKQCVTQQHDIRSKQELINILSSQLKEEHDARKTLEGNLSDSLLRSSTFKQVQAENSEAVRPTLTPNKDDKTHKVIIFHDSLCKNINESLMGREDVTVSQVWAPTLRDSQAKVGEVDKVDTIVIQGVCGGKCMAASVWLRVCGCECVAANEWRRGCGGECVAASVWRRVCGGECVSASVWRRVWGVDCVASSVWRRLSDVDCVAASVAVSGWRRVFGGECETASVWRRVCGGDCVAASVWRRVCGRE